MKQRKKLPGKKNEIGGVVTKLRIERGIPQKELAHQMQNAGVDIGEKSLSDLERQVRPVYDREVRALAKIFGVRMEDLFPKE